MTDARTITEDLGGQYHNGYGSAPCPVCQPEGRREQNALSIRNGDNGILLYCFKENCSFSEIAKAIALPRTGERHNPLAKRGASKKEIERNQKHLVRAQVTWELSKPIEGTKAEAYLRRRGIGIPLPESLRFLPSTYHSPSDRCFDAMVARVLPTGAIHRTFINGRGERLQSSAKLMLGPCSGGAVHLSKGDGPLVIAEGIETGLSVLQAMADQSPLVWAALSTSGVKGLGLPLEPSELVIAADGDDAGRNAARELGNRATELGWKVSILSPPEGKDWNDVLMEGVAS